MLAREVDPRPDHGETSYQGLGKLTGRKALVTGGDSGIGRATAIAFARGGADVAIAYLRDEEADAREVIELIEKQGRTAVALPGDVSDENWCRQMVDEAVSGLGGLDILAVNAGRQQTRPSVDEVTSEDFDRTLKPSGGQPQEKVEKFGENSAFGRPGQPVELAPVYVLLASQEASFITSEVYGVTGGPGIA